MLPIPTALQASFEAYLRTGKIPETADAYYKKWLRFYLGFCRKYHAAPSQRESLPLFLQKLQEKKQAEWQQQQATHAVSLYYELLQGQGHNNLSPPRFSCGRERIRPCSALGLSSLWVFHLDFPFIIVAVVR